MTDVMWEKDAEEALSKVPFFVRKMVRAKVSERVAKNNRTAVTLSDFRESEEKFKALMGGKSEKELSDMMPGENKPGVKMVIINACQHEVSNCPNVLINTTEWVTAIEKWLDEKEVNERLRNLVGDNKILFHHKLKVTVAGCPNGCSRPQIADIGIVGHVKPDVDPEGCTTCGACEDACPDNAITVDNAPPVFDRVACMGCFQCRNICPHKCITVSKPTARVYLGGKLGRHPHFAELAGEATLPEELVAKLDTVIDGYIKDSKSGERFANYWMRTRVVLG